jgi:hypothetical protein
MPTLPGTDEAAAAKLYAVLRDLRDRVEKLERVKGTSAQEATVTVGLVGSTCKITTDAGVVRFIRPIVGYTPVVGHRVIVLDSAWGGVVMGEPHT